MPNNPGQVFCIGAGLLGTVVIKVTKKKKTTFVHPHEEYEHALERVKSAESRIEAVSSLLREMTSECKETKEELSMVVSQKNAIERMLEELEKAKEQAERASRDLQKSVNVLTSELETNKERHVEKVKQWRNEIVSYREKTQENFLAEIVGLVRYGQRYSNRSGSAFRVVTARKSRSALERRRERVGTQSTICIGR